VKHITATFLKGLFTVLPFLLSIYVLLWFLNLMEGHARQMILVVWPEFLYIPGLGALVVFVIIFAIGSVVDRPLARWFFKGIESLVSELPVVKTVYTALKDFTNYLQPGRKNANQVVIVRFPGISIEMVGLMTRENLSDLPEPITKKGRVAVFLPMSYQLGGATVFIPREWVTPTDLSVEVAMRSIITAWLPGHDKTLENL